MNTATTNSVLAKSGRMDSLPATGVGDQPVEPTHLRQATETTAAAIAPNMATMNSRKSVSTTLSNPPGAL